MWLTALLCNVLTIYLTLLNSRFASYHIFRNGYYFLCLNLNKLFFAIILIFFNLTFFHWLLANLILEKFH